MLIQAKLVKSEHIFLEYDPLLLGTLRAPITYSFICMEDF